MAEKIEDGGPAFPREDYQASDAPGQRGMSLRDWFAGQALAGLCAGEAGNNPSVSAQQLGQESYRIADAALQARKGDKL